MRREEHPLEHAVRYEEATRFRFDERTRARREKTYIGAILASTAIYASLGYRLLGGITGRFDIAAYLFALSLFVLSMSMAVASVDLVCAALLRRRPLKAIELEGDISDLGRTLVAIPCLMTNEATVDELVERIASHHAGNAGHNVAFALLTDFRDSDIEVQGDDGALLEQATRGVLRLNEKLGAHFILLNRPRRWNDRDRKWMGYERKRGKLEALNELLIEQKTDAFSSIVGDRSLLQGVRYVVTVDADTLLPAGAVRALVSVIMHPENRDYVLIQPSLSDIAHGPKTLHRKLSQVVLPRISIYQDLSQTSPYFGKGIYDVRRFHDGTKARLPQNWILSHDTIEACLVRVGATDKVTLQEPYPPTYATDMARLHRWIRGDWQLLPWLLPVWLARTIPELRPYIDGRLPPLGRWTIADCIRRGLHAVAMFIWVLIGIGSDARVVWVLTPIFVDAAIIVQMTVTANIGAGRSGREGGGISWLLTRELLVLAVLPHRAFVTIDAAVRALLRMFVTGRERLQWSPYTGGTRGRERIGEYCCRMWVCWAAGISAVLLGWWSGSAAGLPQLLGLLWIAAPALVFATGQCFVPGARPDAGAVKRNPGSG